MDEVAGKQGSRLGLRELMAERLTPETDVFTVPWSSYICHVYVSPIYAVSF
jgi:hypothetical protein